MHPADTLMYIALDRHRERTRIALRGGDGHTSFVRVRVAATLRRAADRLDAGRPEPEPLVPLARGS